MKRYLVVFCFVLAACFSSCLAAGGATCAEDPEHAFLMVLITNQFLYDITRLNVTSPAVSTVLGWLERISKKVRVGIQYSERLYTVLVNRANHVKRKMRELKGGWSRNNFLRREWELKVKPEELQQRSLEGEIEELQSRLHDAEESHMEMSGKIKKLEKDKSESAKKTRKISAQLKTVNKKKKLGTPRSSVRGQNKPPQEYSQSHRRRLKRQRASTCEASLCWLEQEGILPLSVEVKDLQTGKTEKIELNKSEVNELLGTQEEVTEEDLDVVSMMLFVKDKYCVSDGAYQEMAKVCKKMPRHYRIKERIKELWNISPTPNGTVGVQQSFEERIQHLLRTSSPNAPFIQNKCVKVKLSGDGNNMGNFTFTLIEEKTGSCDGQHILAIFKEPENYNSIKKALENIIEEVKGTIQRPRGREFLWQ